MPDSPLTITLVQKNFPVGDIRGNLKTIQKEYHLAEEQGSDLIVFPELALTGYPPEDLLLHPGFQKDAFHACEELVRQSKNNHTALLLGGITQQQGHLYNAAFFIHDGKILARILKHDLPNYGVFDEKRLFTPGKSPRIIDFLNKRIAVLICEEFWNETQITTLNKQSVDLIISIHASPYELNKQQKRHRLAQQWTKTTRTPLIYLNQIGAQDELVFDGGSFVMHPNGHTNILPYWQEHSTSITLTRNSLDSLPAKKEQHPTLFFPSEQKGSFNHIYAALQLAIREYVYKNNFSKVLIGLSGGIDSALTAAIAVDALGKEQVACYMLSSPYTSPESKTDARECAKLLGIVLQEIAIDEAMALYQKMLTPLLPEIDRYHTAENIQARIRGTLLMAISNANKAMLLTTGNKSELAVGYTTLYGDMCGGFNPLKDLYKTQIYALAHWRNTYGRIIPETILHKPPSAELRPNQTDQDSLPPYDILDKILYLFIEQQQSAQQVIDSGFEKNMVYQIATLLKNSEHKRHQAPPGVKISALAFGRDRRYPISNSYDFI